MMSNGGRTLTYPQAILEATEQLMSADESVVVMGLGVTDPIGILGTTLGLEEKFGSGRVFDTPLSEDAMTGAAIGMALAGLKPIHVHIRMDFLPLAMNQIINIAAKTRYMFGGQQAVPLVIRCTIGKSWGQGAQHSQALHSLFMHIPGLQVVMPTSPYDAKGCLVEAVHDNNPTLFIEHRMLYYQQSDVPSHLYRCAKGKGRIAKRGKDISLIAPSFMQVEAYRAASYLDSVGIDAEVIDPIWMQPLDIALIMESTRRTGRLLIIDNGWLACGASAEIMAQVVEQSAGQTMPVMRRMGFANCPCPTTPSLEQAFYPNARSIAEQAYSMVTGKADWQPIQQQEIEQIAFKGPF